MRLLLGVKVTPIMMTHQAQVKKSMYYDEDIDGAFCSSVCQKWAQRSSTTKGSGGVWVDKQFTNWIKAIEKITMPANFILIVVKLHYFPVKPQCMEQ